MEYYDRIKKLSEEGELDKAISIAKEWCESEPSNSKSFYNLGTLLHMDGNNRVARKYLEQCIELEPNHAHGLSNIGSVLCCESKFKEATPYFAQALDLADPGDKGSIMARLADCYINQNLFNKAAPLVQELYELDEEMALMLEGKMVREIIPGKKKPWYRW